MPYKAYSDNELIAFLKKGDNAAYTEIYDRYIFVLLNHAYNKIRNREEAKDVVHEVFTMLWTRRELLELNTSLAGYLYTSLRNIILNQIAHKEVQDKYLLSMQQFAAGNQVMTDHRIRERQLAVVIEQEIAGLPLKMRTVFELSRKEFLTHTEIAERLNISEQTVSKHITNALRILRIKLGIILCILWIIYPN